MDITKLADFIADVVLTSHYLAEPLKKTESELTDAEMRCLRIIARFQPISMHEIAIKLHATKPRATQLVAMLEAHDMIDRQVAQDRRRIEVSTTETGAIAIKNLEKRYEALAHAIQKRLGPDDTAKLTQLLGQITPLTQLPLE